MINPEIISGKERKLVGVNITTTFSENKTKDMWQRFRPQAKDIAHRLGTHFVSVQEYKKGFDPRNMTPATKFKRWAAIEVDAIENIPNSMEFLIISAGKYAVFTYQGTIREFHKTARYFYEKWLPDSVFELDQRPHFEVLGEEYLGPMNPDSKEKIWVPIK